jgi:hypothetical protein
LERRDLSFGLTEKNISMKNNKWGGEGAESPAELEDES